jgi:hypothetical protein
MLDVLVIQGRTLVENKSPHASSPGGKVSAILPLRNLCISQTDFLTGHLCHQTSLDLIFCADALR